MLKIYSFLTKPFVLFIVKAYALLALIFVSVWSVRYVPVIGIMLIVLFFCFIYTIYFTYRYVMRRTISMLTFKSGGWARYFLSRRFLPFIFSFLAGLFFTVILFAELASWQRFEWLILLFIVPVYMFTDFLSNRFFSGESEALYIHYRSSFLASFAAAFIMVLVNIAAVLIFYRHLPYKSFMDAYVALEQPNARSFFINEYFNFAVQYISAVKYSAIARMGELNASIAKGAALLTAFKFTAFLALSWLLAFIRIPFREYRRILYSITDDKDTKANKVSKTAVTAALISIFFYIVFIRGVLWLEEYAYTHPSTGIKSMLLEITGNVVERFDAIIVDNKLYSVKVLEERRRLQEEYLRRMAGNSEHIVDLVNAAFDSMSANVDAYLDWYYSLSGEYLRMVMFAAGNIEQYMQDELAKRLGGGEEVRRLQDAVLMSHEILDEYAADINNILYKNEVKNPNGYNIVKEYNFDDFVSISAEVPEFNKFKQRMGASGAAVLGFTAAGGLIAKKIAANIAAKTGFKAAAGAAGKLALSKVAGGAASSAAGAGIGAAIGSVVPGAGTAVGAGIGFIIGMAVGVGIDATMLSLDELVNREEFKKEILASINEQRRMMLSALGVPDTDIQPER